jgi:hypothetical protein
MMDRSGRGERLSQRILKLLWSAATAESKQREIRDHQRAGPSETCIGLGDGARAVAARFGVAVSLVVKWSQRYRARSHWRAVAHLSARSFWGHDSADIRTDLCLRAGRNVVDDLHARDGARHQCLISLRCTLWFVCQSPYARFT